MIREQDKSINQQKKQIMEKEALNKELKQEFNEISARFKNLSVKLNSKESDYNKLCDDYEMRINNLEEEKVKTEEKVNELIDIVKQQSKELSDFYVQSQLSEKEKKVLQKNFNQVQNEYENCYNANKELKAQFSVINEFKRKINETEVHMNQLHDELLVEREKNNNLEVEKNVI